MDACQVWGHEYGFITIVISKLVPILVLKKYRRARFRTSRLSIPTRLIWKILLRQFSQTVPIIIDQLSIGRLRLFHQAMIPRLLRYWRKILVVEKRLLLARVGARSRGQHEDSGAMIARQLGMSVKEYDRLGYLDKPGCPEEEFWGYGAQEVVWEDELPGALLFTGFHGGKVWANDPMNTSPGYYPE